jgi:predicted phosphodiesterase
VKFGRDVFVKFEELSGQLKTIAQNLHTLYGRIDSVSNTLMPDEEGDTFRVLHISDIHNNVAAFPFVREVANKFQVAFIVDTGDLTDFGSALEAGIMQGIRRLPYPYVIALGNHDSPKVGKALADVPNVTLLDGTLKTVKDVRIIGIPNPAAARQGLEGINPSPEEMKANQTELLQRIRALPEPPDIVAIHDPRQAYMVWGRVPLVLCGHMHQQGIEEQTAPPAGTAVPDIPRTEPALTTPATIKTVVCNAGTTGAAGTRYFSKKTGVPFTCAVLTFRRPPQSGRTADAKPPTGASAGPRARPTLYAIELISLDGSLHEYSLSRRTFPAPPTPANASP